MAYGFPQSKKSEQINGVNLITYAFDGKKKVRYIREIIYGKKRAIQYWEITRDKENLAEAESWFVMTKIPGVKYKEVGAIYGVRTWMKYGFKQ